MKGGIGVGRKKAPGRRRATVPHVSWWQELVRDTGGPRQCFDQVQAVIRHPSAPFRSATVKSEPFSAVGFPSSLKE